MYRLNWIGSLWPSRHSDVGFEIDAQFVPEDRTRPIEVVRLPLGALPKLIIGSVWANGVFAKWTPRNIAEVTVDVPGFEGLGAPLARAARPFELLPLGTYPLHGLKGASWCRIFRPSEGPDLVVPNWEILRIWYLFHSRVMPAVLGGGFEHPDTVSRRLLPWHPEETRRVGPNGCPQLMRAKNVTDDVAMKCARLLFNPTARRRSYQIYRHLHSSAHQSSSMRASIFVPAILPPYEGSARWRVWYAPIPATNRSPERRLVLRIILADLPEAYDVLDIIPANSGDQGSNKDDPTLKPAWVNPPRPAALPPDGALDVYGTGSDNSVEDVDLEGFAFWDSAVERVTKRIVTRSEQKSRRSADSGEPVSASAISLDPTAPPRPAQPSEASNEEDESTPSAIPPAASIAETLHVFRAIAQRLREVPQEGLEGWSAELLPLNAECLRVHSEERGESRHFLILRCTDGDRCAYLLDAERLRKSEVLPLLICADVAGGQITLPRFTDWLSNFPYREGSVWFGIGDHAYSLKGKSLKHQQRRIGDTEDHIAERCVSRLIRKLQEFVEVTHIRQPT